MALKIVCDSCGDDIERGNAFRRKTTFVAQEGGAPHLSYTNDNEDFCKPCVEKEAAPFANATVPKPRKPRTPRAAPASVDTTVAAAAVV